MTRQETIARVLELVDHHGNAPLHLADICRATDVSERTLRSLFREFFGVGPNRYLRTRRLHLLRAALQIEDPRNTTVAAIAARFGYTDTGRMASEYHTLFGEYPRETLARRITE